MTSFQKMTAILLSSAAPALVIGLSNAANATATMPSLPIDAQGSTNTAIQMVGGVPMDAGKSIVDNAASAPNLTTLVAAVKAGGLAETLSGDGPFTVFAPTNDAFGRLSPGALDTLLKPENKALLTKVLTYHVIPGRLSLAELDRQITAGNGKAVLTTVEGEPLIVEREGAAMRLTDVNGNKAFVELADVRQSNGVVHIVNGVVLPKLG